jgi:chemotaxis protein methyltransferase CheR
MASIPDLALSGLSRLLAKEMGLRFPRERWGELERGISAASREFGFASAAECIRWLTSAPLSRPQVETLARHLTVGETYFFRDP